MLNNNRFYSYALLFFVIFFGYLSYQIFKPFLSPIAWAIVLSIIFYPLYNAFLRYLRWKPVASIITLFIILVIIFGPVSYLSYVLTQELKSSMMSIEEGRSFLMDTLFGHPAIKSFLMKILSWFNMSEVEFQKAFINSVTQFGRESAGMIKGGLENIASAVVDFILMILSLFFFFTDGVTFLEKIENYMPFSRRQKERLVKQIKDIVISTIYGGVTVAVVQGIIGGIAFSILGISLPVMWGFAMFFCSFIPLVGTFIIWGPAALYLMLKGTLLKGIILLIIGIAGISSVDNILRPLIIRGRLKMPTLAIFFSILGGIKVFGFIGFIMGPLVLALFISIVEIYRYTEEETETQKTKGS